MTTLAQPTFEDEASLFSLATEYLEAADMLIQAPAIKVNVSLVIYFLLGHAGELLLKSFLLKRGVSLDDLKYKLGHNLTKLIRCTRNLGLPESLPLLHLKDLSKNYEKKSTEYRQLKLQSYPQQDALLAELRTLERVVFNHVVATH